MASIKCINGSYKIAISCGYDAKGKQLRHFMTYKPSPNMTPKQIEKEVQRQATLFEERVRNGQHFDSNIKIADFSEMWFNDYVIKQLSPKTAAQYKALLGRINEGLGHLKLGQLQAQHIIKWLDALSKEGIRADAKCCCKLDLKGCLKSRGISKVKLSELAELNINTIDNAVKGNNISFKSAKKISSALNIPLAQLFDVIDNGSLSDKTQKHYYTVLSSMLQTAVYWQIIPFNPCDRVSPPKVKQKEALALNDEQARELLAKLDTLGANQQKYKIMITMLMFCGFRREELLGLKWNDINFKTNCVSISRTLQYLPSVGIYESDTKTSSSKRVNKLPEYIIALLKDFQLSQFKERSTLGDYRINTDYIFTRDNGEPIHPDTLSDWFKKFQKDNGFKEIISLHGLRHTYATLMIAEGVPVTTVSNKLGHANAATTTRIYAHAIKSADEAAAEAIESVLLKKA